MSLRAKAPVNKGNRLKMFDYGPAGCGKTTAAIQFPHAYIIDTEGGTDHYADTINKAGSVVLQTSSIHEVIAEVHALLTEEHDYQTLIIDPFTHLYNDAQDYWTRIFEKYAANDKAKETQDFGAGYWGKVKRDVKRLERMMMALDMNLIVTAHQKNEYGENMKKLGVTFDSMRGDDYVFDLIFRVERFGDKLMAYKVKERADILVGQKFPDSFEWSYDNFANFYGRENLERKAVPVVMATDKQVARVKQLVEALRIEETETAKWFSKAKVEDWDEMTSETIGKTITFLENKLEEVKNA